MYTLHCVTQIKTASEELLQEACKTLDVPFNVIKSTTYNPFDYPVLTDTDLVYRIGTDNNSVQVEKTLINAHCTTFYASLQSAFIKPDNVFQATLFHEQLGLSVIPTLYYLGKARAVLRGAIEQLGGFPLIIKVVGGSHGVGVIRVDSQESFFSLVDFLTGQNTMFIVRKFINYKYHVRLIVLGNKVIDSIQYKKVAGDFRSNVGSHLHIEPITCNTAIRKTAVDSCKALGFEFGGVDILIDQDGKHYLAEVNFPCFFPRTQLATGTNIAEQMVQYLIKKAQKKRANKTA